MIDALLATVSDPFQAMMSVVFLFALGMYPVGLMLGSSCSACCEENPCTLCEEGSLPDTITVTFDNLPNQTRSQDLLRVGFSSCFGSGATARILDPGGDPDSAGGPIASVSLTSGGSGYAKFARVEPELSVSSAGNNDAEFSFSFTQTDDSCGIPTWGVAGVTVTKAGTGYTNNTPVTFTANEGTTQDFSGSGTLINFLVQNSAIGSIQTNGTTTSYVTSSDYRLKTDAQPMVGASARVLALKPVNFAWKADGTRVDGFLAHEAQAVVPECVTGTKDAVDEDGNPVYQGIDQSKLVPLLTAALQEALTKIEALEARITALESA